MKHTVIYRFFLTAVLSLAVNVAFAQRMEVTGKVTDEKGEPMPGVGVVDKNNPRNGTVTDLDGLYKIKIAKDGFLEFSFISYENALVPVDGRKMVNVRQGESGVTVLRSGLKARFIRLHDRNYFSLLRDKLSEWTH